MKLEESNKEAVPHLFCSQFSRKYAVSKSLHMSKTRKPKPSKHS